jgi:hypothetical protein
MKGLSQSGSSIGGDENPFVMAKMMSHVTRRMRAFHRHFGKISSVNRGIQTKPDPPHAEVAFAEHIWL